MEIVLGNFSFVTAKMIVVIIVTNRTAKIEIVTSR